MKRKIINKMSWQALQKKFKKAWEESEVEYRLAKQLIDKRLAERISQRQLAKKLKTSQAVISRIETMQANPSLFPEFFHNRSFILPLNSLFFLYS